MKLTDIGYIKQLMEENGVVFKKKFGQNFLTSESVLERIAGNTDRGVLEIGPGIGALTAHLADRAEKVAAIEIDRGLIPILEKTVGTRENVTLICGDVLEVDLPSLVAREFPGMSVSVCANLPYYITTPVLTRLMTCGAPFTNLTVMVQKEVAARLCAAPGTPDYGAITVFTAYHGRASRVIKVPAGCFVPPPKVDSAVVRIDIFSAPPVPADPELLFRCVRAAFGQRRKTLSNALASGFPELERERVSRAIADCGLDPAVRGEALSLENFSDVAVAISGLLAK